MLKMALWIVNTVGILVIGAMIFALLAAVRMYIVDRLQRQHAIRRNFPLVGRMRYGIENLGPFLRQYLYDTDRDRLPFNRAERSWVYRAAKNLDNTAAFGSTLDLMQPGTIIFANSVFPVLEQMAEHPRPLPLGPHTPNPYLPQSIFNISGMSFAAP